MKIHDTFIKQNKQSRFTNYPPLKLLEMFHSCLLPSVEEPATSVLITHSSGSIILPSSDISLTLDSDGIILIITPAFELEFSSIKGDWLIHVTSRTKSYHTYLFDIHFVAESSYYSIELDEDEPKEKIIRLFKKE